MANTIPITSKPIVDFIQPEATLLGVQNNVQGIPSLFQFPTHIIRKTPTLLDTFTVAEGEEPVLFFEKKLTGQNWRHVWINGEIYSSDTAASQTFHLRTGAGTEIFRQAFKYWDRGKAYVSAEMRRMPNGRIVGEIALSLHQYTNELGVYGKSVGRFNAEYINGVHISLDNQTQMFAAGTQIEVWGME